MIAAGLLVVVGVVAAVAGTGDDDDDVIIDREPVGSGAGGAEAATVAVTFGEPSPGTAPADLQLRFVDGAGGEIASRSWSEVEQDAGGSGGTALPGGLLQGVPSGELRLEATLQQPDGTSSCTQQFRTTQGDRLILRLEQGQLGGASLGGMAPDAGGGAAAPGDQPCATVQPVAEWVEGRTSPSGEPYVGLSQADAEARARSDGLTTRVVGIDGADFMVTMDLRPDRLDLMIFDGTVVAAQLGAESPTAGVS